MTFVKELVNPDTCRGEHVGSRVWKFSKKNLQMISQHRPHSLNLSQSQRIHKHMSLSNPKQSRQTLKASLLINILMHL